MTRTQYIHMIRAEARDTDVRQYIAFLEDRAAKEAQLAQRYKVQRFEIAAAGIAAAFLAIYFLTRRAK